jgi:hypothetical protein
VKPTVAFWVCLISFHASGIASKTSDYFEKFIQFYRCCTLDDYKSTYLILHIIWVYSVEESKLNRQSKYNLYSLSEAQSISFGLIHPSSGPIYKKQVAGVMEWHVITWHLLLGLYIWPDFGWINPKEIAYASERELKVYIDWWLNLIFSLEL